MIENIESGQQESVADIKKTISDRLGLVAEENSDKNFLKLKLENTDVQEGEKILERRSLNKPEDICHYFESFEMIEPDRICRPKGDTTFFTTAGIQHIETVLKEQGKLERKVFTIAQPVIRSQFMDKVKEGTSTSFVNFSVEYVDSNLQEFVSLSEKLIKLVLGQGIDSKDVKFKIEETQDAWGNKKFTKAIFTLYFKNIEIGECVYIYDYPVSQNKTISITDLGFGIERFNWGLGKSKFYFSEFEKFYETINDINKISSVIDCVRSMVLIAGEGIQPSNHDHGYRLRQFSKRFITRKRGLDCDIDGMVRLSYEWWKKWGYLPGVSEDNILEVIKTENDRNFNSLFLAELGKSTDQNIYININQSTDSFLKQAGFSLSSEEIRKIINKLK